MGLLEEFDRSVAGNLPQFHRMEQTPISSASRLYCWRREDGITAFLLFYKYPQRHRFAVEAAWSMRNRYPIDIPSMKVRAVARADIIPDYPIQGEFRFRVSDLWAPGKNLSWRIVPGHRQHIAEATKQIRVHFLPYLEQLDPQARGGWSLNNALNGSLPLRSRQT